MSTLTAQFPDNVIPQYRSSQPTGPSPCLQCPPDDSLEAVLFDKTSLAVIRGFEWKAFVDLKDFFQPCDNFASYEIMIPKDDTVTLNYGPAADSDGNVLFLMVFPQYQKTSVSDQTMWNMTWKNVGATADNGLGRLLILNGTADLPIGPIEIQNLVSDTLEVKILIAR